MSQIETNEWVNAEHAQGFLDRRDQLPQLEVGYSELLSILPLDPKRVTISSRRPAAPSFSSSRHRLGGEQE